MPMHGELGECFRARSGTRTLSAGHFSTVHSVNKHTGWSSQEGFRKCSESRFRGITKSRKVVGWQGCADGATNLEITVANLSRRRGVGAKTPVLEEWP